MAGTRTRLPRVSPKTAERASVVRYLRLHQHVAQGAKQFGAAHALRAVADQIENGDHERFGAQALEWLRVLERAAKAAGGSNG